MLSFQVEECECCGEVIPFQNDSRLGLKKHPKDPHNASSPQSPVLTQFHRNYLRAPYHDAWKCTCNGFCRGQQFYPVTRPKQLQMYYHNHDSRFPEQVEQVNPHLVQKVRICDRCHSESSRSGGDLTLARRFSSRNGYGPVRPFSEDFPPEPQRSPLLQERFLLHREYWELMSNLSIPEEAAIRQVSPFISIAKLRGVKHFFGHVRRQRLLDLLGTHAIQIDTVGEVVDHRLQLHPVSLGHFGDDGLILLLVVHDGSLGKA